MVKNATRRHKTKRTSFWLSQSQVLNFKLSSRLSLKIEVQPHPFVMASFSSTLPPNTPPVASEGHAALCLQKLVASYLVRHGFDGAHRDAMEQLEAVAEIYLTQTLQMLQTITTHTSRTHPTPEDFMMTFENIPSVTPGSVGSVEDMKVWLDAEIYKEKTDPTWTFGDFTFSQTTPSSTNPPQLPKTDPYFLNIRYGDAESLIVQSAAKNNDKGGDDAAASGNGNGGNPATLARSNKRRRRDLEDDTGPSTGIGIGEPLLPSSSSIGGGAVGIGQGPGGGPKKLDEFDKIRLRRRDREFKSLGLLGGLKGNEWLPDLPPEHTWKRTGVWVGSSSGDQNGENMKGGKNEKEEENRIGEARVGGELDRNRATTTNTTTKEPQSDRFAHLTSRLRSARLAEKALTNLIRATASASSQQQSWGEGAGSEGDQMDLDAPGLISTPAASGSMAPPLPHPTSHPPARSPSPSKGYTTDPLLSSDFASVSAKVGLKGKELEDYLMLRLDRRLREEVATVDFERDWYTDGEGVGSKKVEGGGAGGGGSKRRWKF